MIYDEFDDFSSMSVIHKNNGGLVEKRCTGGNNILSKQNDISGAVQDNFDKILDIAGGLVEVRKMKVQSEAILKKMAEDRKALMAEAEVYATKLNADTKSIVDRMNIVRMMLKDFYEASNGSMTSEDFRIIITETINQMNRMQ